MNLCQLIQQVLDYQYQAVQVDNRDSLVVAEMDRLSALYRNLKSPSRAPVNYASKVTRFAYIYRYTVAHADYVRQVAERSREIQQCFNGPATVACLGGGPGSDYLGILKFMEKWDKCGPVSIQLFDRERAWSDAWMDVAGAPNLDFRVIPAFCQMDVTDPETYRSYDRFLSSDLFTFVYFMSELWFIRDKAEPFFDYVFSCAKPGSLFLYIDNHDSDFSRWFDGLAGRNGVDLLRSDDGIGMCFGNEEEKRDLGIYYDKFKFPKRESTVSIRVGRKE